MIETYFRSTIYYEFRKNLFYMAEKKLEEMKKIVVLNPKYKGEDISEFSGCPAAGPYITGLFTTKKLAEDFDREITELLTRFRARIIE